MQQDGECKERKMRLILISKEKPERANNHEKRTGRLPVSHAVSPWHKNCYYLQTIHLIS